MHWHSTGQYDLRCYLPYLNFHDSTIQNQAKRKIYTNLKINCTDNFFQTRFDTAANENLMPATVYTQIYEDPNQDGLGSMGTYLSM